MSSHSCAECHIQRVGRLPLHVRRDMRVAIQRHRGIGLPGRDLCPFWVARCDTQSITNVGYVSPNTIAFDAYRRSDPRNPNI
jgi:hypothetical protein